MKRYKILQDLLQPIINEIIITSCGMISREVYQIKDRDRNFYMLGSMGAELAFGLGLAYQRPDLQIIVISGDGSALMGLSSLVLHKKLNLPNIKHYVLDNRCYATTGGQKTCSDAVDFESLAPNTYVLKCSDEKGDAPRIPLKPIQIKERFCESICKQE